MKTQIYVLVALAACSGLLLPIFSAGLLESSATIYFSGVVQQTSTGTYSFIISVSGSDYMIQNGTTAEIEYQSKNATQVVNDAICNLTQGGNILIKAGIYDLNGTIAATGINNIGLYFEKGAVLFVSNGMNDAAIEIHSCNNWLIENPTISGNAANQAHVPARAGDNYMGIYIAGGSNNRVDGANITQCGVYGVFVYPDWPTGSMKDSGVTNSLVTLCGWNGIELSKNSSSCYAINNEIAYSGDVGISSYGHENIVQDNHVHDMNGTLGSQNSRWGIAVEGGGNDTITENTVVNCYEGLEATLSYDANTFSLNTVENCDRSVWIGSNYNTISNNNILQYDPDNAGESGIHVTGNYTQILYNVLNSTYADGYAIDEHGTGNRIIGNSIASVTSQAWYCIEVEGNYTDVEQNNIISGKFGIIIDSDANNAAIIDNDVSHCIGTRISDAGTATSIYNNTGYNPIGYIASPINSAGGNLIVDSGANATWVSTTTYTNWESPKVLYVTGGIVTAIVVDGQTLTPSATNMSIPLQPGGTFSVTFAAAPTIKVLGQ